MALVPIFMVWEAAYNVSDLYHLHGSYSSLDSALKHAESLCASLCVTEDGTQIYSDQYIKKQLVDNHFCSVTPHGSMEDDVVIAIVATMVHADIQTAKYRTKEVEQEINERKKRESAFLNEQELLGIGI